MDMNQFKARVVETANRNRARITTDFSSVLRIVDAAEIVVAVWQDPREDGGIGMLIIKGEPTLNFIAKSGVP